MPPTDSFDLIYGDPEDDHTITESFATAETALARARALAEWVDVWFGAEYCCKVAPSGDIIQIHDKNGWRVRAAVSKIGRR